MTAPPGPAAAHAGLPLGRAALALAVLATLHLAVIGGRSELAVALLVWALAAGVALSAWRAAGGKAWLLAGLAGALAALGALQAAAPVLEPRIALVLPPTLGNLTVAGVFAYTLLPGHEPAIVRVARVSRGGPVPADLAAYARKVTWLWALLPAAVAAAALSALALHGLAAWSWIANVANPALLLLAFVGEHALRGRLFPQYGPASLRRTLRVVLDKRAWPLPQPGHG